MVARMGEARVAAFLAALRETGNQTVAAERARFILILSATWQGGLRAVSLSHNRRSKTIWGRAARTRG